VVTAHDLAAEVLELGQTLFDSVLEGAVPSDAAGTSSVIDLEEALSAANEFFTALRLLLGLEESRS